MLQFTIAKCVRSCVGTWGPRRVSSSSCFSLLLLWGALWLPAAERCPRSGLSNIAPLKHSHLRGGGS